MHCTELPGQVIVSPVRTGASSWGAQPKPVRRSSSPSSVVGSAGLTLSAVGSCAALGAAASTVSSARPASVGRGSEVAGAVTEAMIACPRVASMVSAVVLLSLQRDRINEVAERLVELQGVTEVYSVAGQWDLVAVLRVKDNDALADLVTGQLLKVPGIIRSETLIAFRVLSRYDLERMFSVGMEA